MQRVMLPGGVAVDFPDGMSPQDMQAALATMPGPAPGNGQLPFPGDTWEQRMEAKTASDLTKSRGLRKKPQEPMSYLEAQERVLGKSPLPNLEAGLSQAGLGFLSLGSRITGFGDADAINRESDVLSQAADTVSAQDSIPDILQRGVRGVAATLPQSIVAGVAGGPVAAIAMGSVSEANRAVTEARDRGLPEDEVARYALLRGGIEGTIAGVFQKVGLGGMERAFEPAVAKELARQGVKEWLKGFAKQTFAELTEEELTELSHVVAERTMIGDKESQITPGKIGQTMADTAVQTLMTMGLVQGASTVAGRLADPGKKRLGKRDQQAPTTAVDPGLVPEPSLGPEPQISETPSPIERSSVSVPPPAAEVTDVAQYTGEEVIQDAIQQEEGQLQGRPQGQVDPASDPTLPETAGMPVSEQPPVAPDVRAELAAMTPKEVEQIWRQEFPEQATAPSKTEMIEQLVSLPIPESAPAQVEAAVTPSEPAAAVEPPVEPEAVTEPVVAPEAIAEPVAKQPWEMTRDEAAAAGWRDNWSSVIRRNVEYGKPVPEGVIAELAAYDAERVAGSTSKAAKVTPVKKGDTVVRYTHKDGKGLMNNEGLDRSKLTDDEEAELVELMDLGLRQPPAGTTGTFYFTPDGERQHARLLELLSKASKTGVVRTESALHGAPTWESTDGQVAATEPISEPKTIGKTKPTRKEIIEQYQDTRGSGVQYHGASRPIEGFDEGYYSSDNIYGNGFYTTDSVGVAASYQGKNKGDKPNVVRISELKPVKLMDLDQPVDRNSPEGKAFIETIEYEADSPTEVNADYGLEYLNDHPNATYTQVIEEIRIGSHRDEFQDMMYTLRNQLEQQGYGGLSHVGGRKTKTGHEHQVRIYWTPETDLAVGGVELDEFLPQPEAPKKRLGKKAPVAETMPSVEPTTKPLYESLGDDGTKAQVFQANDGYTVSVLDTASGERLPTMRTFKNLDRAKAYADTIEVPETVAEPKKPVEKTKKSIGKKPAIAKEPPAEPTMPAVARKTPAKGTPERDALDMEVQQAEDEREAAADAAFKAKEAYQKAGYGTKRREQLSKKHDKLEAASNAAWEKWSKLRDKWLEANLEDAAESTDPVQSAVAALELERKRTGTIPAERRKEVEALVTEKVTEAARLASKVDADGLGVLPPKDEQAAIDRAISTVSADLIGSPLSAGKKLTDLVGGRLRGERLREYRMNSTREVEAIENITPSQVTGYSQQIRDSYDFDKIAEIAEQAKQDVAARAKANEAEEQATREARRANQFSRDLTVIKPKNITARGLPGYLSGSVRSYSFLNTAKESGIVTDGRMAFKATPQDAQAIASAPEHQGVVVPRKTLELVMAMDKKKSYSPAKLVGARASRGERVESYLLESESGSRLVVDAKMLHVIRSRYPQAEMLIADKNAEKDKLYFQVSGDTVAVLMPFSESSPMLEDDLPPTPKKSVAKKKPAPAPPVTPAAEPAPSRIDAYISPEEQERQSMGAKRKVVKSAADLVGDYDSEPTGKPSKYASPNEEFEKRWQIAKRGVGKKSLATKAREIWDAMVKMTVRGSLPELPRTEQFGEARSALNQWQNAPAYAAFTAESLLGRTVKPLTEEDYDLFARVVVLRDVADSEGAKPFGLDDASAKAELDLVEGHAADNPRVQAALEYREQWLKDLVDDYIDAHKAIGIDLSSKFTRDRYFRHQVLYYYAANQMQKQGSLGSKKAQVNMQRGFLKRRKGSDLDINANYLEAEWEVATQMLADTKRVQQLARLDRTYGIMDKLKSQAKQQNYVSVVGGQANFDRLQDLRAQKDATDDKKVRAELTERIWELDPTMPFRQQMAMYSDIAARKITELMGSDPSQFNAIMNKVAQDPKHPQNGIALAYFKAVNEREMFLRETLGENYVTWEDIIPEDYDRAVIRPGKAMFQAYSLPEAMANELLEGLSETLNIKKDDLRRLTALGSDYAPLVLPNEIVAQMENMSEASDSAGLVGSLYRGVSYVSAKAKRWMLLSPHRVVKYNLRNFSEVDKVLAFNPQVMKKVPQAAMDLWKVFRGSDDIPAMAREWVERGGAGQLVRVQELGDLSELKRFAHLASSKQKDLSSIPGKVWRGYWEASEITSDYRESILRYAAFLQYAEEVKKNGRPNNYGGSIANEVKGIKDPLDKAMRLSDDLLGAYDDISVLGQVLRKTVFPFWSFQETNIKTYMRGVRNLASDEQTAVKAGMAIAKAVGVGSLAKAPFLAYKLGRIGILFFGAKALITAINAFTMDDDDEDDIPEEVKRGVYLYLGRDSEGNVRYFSRLGTSSDVLDWLGLDAIDIDAKDVLDGRKSMGEVAKDYGYTAMRDKLYNMLTPFIKAPVEAGLGYTAYPSLDKPKKIRDTGEYVSRIVGLEEEYKTLAGKPRRGAKRAVANTFYYTSEGGTTQYYSTLDAKERWMKETLGRSPGAAGDSPRSQALFNYKQALRFDDAKAAERYLNVYQAEGGNTKGLEQSLASMHPLSGLTVVDELNFLGSLNDDEQKALAKAEKYYYEELLTPAEAERMRTKRKERLIKAVKSKALLSSVPDDPEERAQYEQGRETVMNYLRANQGQPDVQEAIQATLTSQTSKDLLKGRGRPRTIGKRTVKSEAEAREILAGERAKYDARRQAALEFQAEFAQ